MEGRHKDERLIEKLKAHIELSRQPSPIEPNVPFLDTHVSTKGSCVDSDANTSLKDRNLTC